jgi:hypothetical protein
MTAGNCRAVRTTMIAEKRSQMLQGSGSLGATPQTQMGPLSRGSKPQYVSAKVSQAASESDDTAATGSKPKKKGKVSRQRALETACPSELREQLHDRSLQGLVIECARKSYRETWRSWCMRLCNNVILFDVWLAIYVLCFWIMYKERSFRQSSFVMVA